MVAQPSHDRRICKLQFDRGKLRVVSCLNSFEQKHSSGRKEIATLHEQSFGNATLAPASVSASSLKRPHVAILRMRRLQNLFSVSSRAKHQ